MMRYWWLIVAPMLTACTYTASTTTSYNPEAQAISNFWTGVILSTFVGGTALVGVAWAICWAFVEGRHRNH